MITASPGGNGTHDLPEYPPKFQPNQPADSWAIGCDTWPIYIHPRSSTGICSKPCKWTQSWQQCFLQSCKNVHNIPESHIQITGDSLVRQPFHTAMSFKRPGEERARVEHMMMYSFTRRNFASVVLCWKGYKAIDQQKNSFWDRSKISRGKLKVIEECDYGHGEDQLHWYIYIFACKGVQVFQKNH